MNLLKYIKPALINRTLLLTLLSASLCILFWRVTGLLLPFAFIPFFYLLYEEKNLSKAFLSSLIFSLFSLVLFNWVWGYKPAIYVLTAIINLTFFSVFGLLSVYLLNKISSLKYFIFPAVWVFIMAFMSILYHGDFLMEYSIALPVPQLLFSIIGARGMTFLFILINSLFAYSLHKKSRKIFLITAAILIGIILLSPVHLVRLKRQESIQVAAVQGNFPETWSWRKKFVNEIIGTYTELSKSARQNDIIIWPEYAIPVDFINYRANIRKSIQSLAKELGSYLVTGSVDYNAATDDHEDIALVFSPDGALSGRYSSVSPFYFNEHTKASKSSPLPVSINRHKVAILICAEELRPDLVRRYCNRSAEYIISLVNNQNMAWGMIQTSMFSRVRAMESFRYVIRASNNGITQIVDPYGRRDAVESHKRRILEGTVIPLSHRTFYTIFGNLLLNLFITVLCITWLLPYLKKIRGE
ncbi:MAG: nitrilase-related carbon-nitrogen hydrolase [Elusimicrobiota bacterium]